MKERKHMDKNQDAIEHYLDDVVIALNQRHANQEMEIKGEYNSIKDEVRNKVCTFFKERKKRLALVLKSVFSEIRVRTCSSSFPLKNRPIIC